MTITSTTTSEQGDQAAAAGGEQQFELPADQRPAADEQVMDAVDAECTPPGEQVMDLLEGHVPLSLIMDLTAPAGPDSKDILSTEGKPDASWWLDR